MLNERVDSNLIRFFDTAATSSSEITSTHGIAAILHDDHAQEILKELPAIGPSTYLSNLGVLVADVEGGAGASCFIGDDGEAETGGLPGPEALQRRAGLAIDEG